MSYPKDLDEYTDAELQSELEARRANRSMGLCDYCKRNPMTSNPCKFSERHELAKEFHRRNELRKFIEAIE